MLTIGDLAKTSGVKVPTIRYYEQMGLMTASERTEGNQRRYTHTESDRLTFIKHARDLGMTIEAIRELLDLSQHPEKPCADADRIAVEQLRAVRTKIDNLRKLEAELERITTHCHNGQVRDCYVIRALADHNLCQGDHD